MSANAIVAEPASVKGWCPGALRPMQTGDGLIVRVRPRCGALSVAEMQAVCGIAERYGNCLIDLTRRANLQIRGVEARELPRVWDALSEAGLIDEHADAEAVRNVMVGPLAGLDPTEISDVRSIAAALETALLTTPGLWALPGKFGFVVDGGGLLGLGDERADIRLKAIETDGGIGIAVGIERADGPDWLRVLDPARAHVAAVRLALAFIAAPKPQRRARLRDLDPAAVAALQAALEDCGVPADLPTSLAPSACCRVGPIETHGAVFAVGLGVPFGRVMAPSLSWLAEAAAELGIAAFRLSPWRVLYALVSDNGAATRLLTAARTAGFVTTPDDLRMAIDACPGAPACRSAWADTRAAALRIAGMLPFSGVASVHVSGCAKGCARSRAADLVLVAEADGFGIVRNGTAADMPEAVVKAANLHDLPALLLART